MPSERKELCRDVVGKRVKLTRTITTRGEKVFRKGRIGKVYGTWRGRFHIDFKQKGEVYAQTVRRVHRSEFVVLS